MPIQFMTAPKPDRSDIVPNFAKTPDNPVLDLGWNEGTLSDGRPYRVEAWCEDQVHSLTFFMSTVGIENLSNAMFADLLVREALLAYRSVERRSAYAMPCTDAGGNSIWSINVVTGDDEDVFVDVLVDLHPYAARPTTASLHNAPAADVAWRALAASLASCLAALAEDEFLIISSKTTNYYVQFAALGHFGMRAEASSNTFIEPEQALIDVQYAAMTDMGWQRATQTAFESGVSDDPDGSPNFHIDIASPVNHAALSQLTVATLREVYGIRHPGQLQYTAFGADNISIRFPTLGLKRPQSQ